MSGKFSDFDAQAYIRRMDRPEKYEKVYRVFVEIVVKNVEQANVVLDVASGPGVLTCALAQKFKNARILGIDISQEMVSYAKEKAKRLGCENVDFLLADALALPFPDRMFDLIVCRGFLKVVAEPKKLLTQCWRVLRPGGKMFFSDTYYEGLEILAEICKEKEEFEILENALKHSLKLQEILEIFRPYPSSIFLCGISAYIMCKKPLEGFEPSTD